VRRQAHGLPSREPHAPGFRRLWSVRYAEDWLLGLSGPRHEAEPIKQHLAEFRRDTLQLALSQEKTLSSQARTHGARFLGDDSLTRDADDKQDQRRQRGLNGAPGLQVPRAVLHSTWAPYLRHGNPPQLPARLPETASTIVTQYPAE
jgi:hypothetical protein